MASSSDASRRFTGRVDDYVRGRPGYPATLFDHLVTAVRLDRGSLIADIGAGSGLSAAPFLRRGLAVVAVEPNAEMRRACDARLGGEPGLRIVDATAEATGLDAASIDLVFAAQAFHWFDVAAARREWSRILRPGGVAALVWNARRATGTAFAEAYEALLVEHGTDYSEVGHRGVAPATLRRFFGAAPRHERFANAQTLDREGLRARLMSSSYVPAPGAPGHPEMLAALDELFSRHARDGTVTLDYDVDLFRGALRSG